MFLFQILLAVFGGGIVAEDDADLLQPFLVEAVDLVEDGGEVHRVLNADAAVAQGAHAALEGALVVGVVQIDGLVVGEVELHQSEGVMSSGGLAQAMESGFTYWPVRASLM